MDSTTEKLKDSRITKYFRAIKAKAAAGGCFYLEDDEMGPTGQHYSTVQQSMAIGMLQLELDAILTLVMIKFVVVLCLQKVELES